MAGTGVSSGLIGGVGGSSGIRNQTAVVYDCLSEGPIEGLVDGPHSIIIDGNPAAGKKASQYFQIFRSPNVAYNSTTKVVTDQGGGNMFANLTTTQGTRTIQVVAAKKRATDATTVAGDTIITTGSAFFASDDKTDLNLNQFPQYVRIEGAGIDGAEYTGTITQFINTTAVRVASAPATAVSNKKISIDLVDTVASFSGATATLSTGGGITTSATAASISPPVTSAGNPTNYNFNNFGWAFLPGTRTQPYLPTPKGTGSASIAHNIGQKLDQTDLTGIGYPTNSQLGIDTDVSPNRSGEAGISRVASSGMNIADPGEVDHIRVTLEHPGMFSTKKKNGTTRAGFAEYRIVFSYKTDSTDQFTNNEVVVFGRQTLSSDVSRYHANTRFKDAQTGIITSIYDGTKSPFQSTIAFDISKYQPFVDYKIEVQRVSPVNQKENGWQQTNSGQVKSIENIITDKLKYPYTSYAAIVVDAEDFSSVPKRAYDIRGLKIQVPTNYFPRDEIHDNTGARRAAASYTRNLTTGADTGADVDWDGNFRGDKNTFDATSPNYNTVYCNNPVWVFMDLLTNPRYGLGKFLNEEFDFSQIDKYTMYNLAKYCDELVPDGKGGTEPRFTTNLYIQKGEDALKLLKQFATTIRGMLIWQNGQVTLNGNREKGAVYTFSKANVLDGTFNYSGSSKRFRTNEVKVSWNDPENQFKQAVEVVTDDNEIAKTGRVISKAITAFGCTSQGQAHRLGKWHLLTEKLEKETVNFKTGINGGALRVGDVILVQDADETDIQMAGRITTAVASTTTVIRPDRDLSSTLNTDDNFDLHLIYPSGGAYLGQPTATINSTVFREGDLILNHANGSAITTQASASQLKDDAGAFVQVNWSENQRVETKAISSFNASSVTVSSAFSAAPDGEVIYAVSGQTAQGADVTGSAKEYIIVNIKEDGKEMNFQITAAEYDRKKFSEIDRGWVIPDIPDVMRAPKRDEEVPSPRNLVVFVSPDSDGGDASEADPGVTGYKAVVNWVHPISVRTDQDGNTIQDKYEHLAGYDIEHDVPQYDKEIRPNGFVREAIRNNTTSSFTIRNIQIGEEYRVRIRTVNTQAVTSEFIQTKFAFTGDQQTPRTALTIGEGLNNSIMKGGTLSTGMSINSSTGVVTFDSSTYSFTPPSDADTINIASGNTNFTQQTFGSLSDGEKGFLLYDYDGNLARGATRTDPLRPLVIGTDNVATSNVSSEKYRFSFLKRLGQSNDDIVQASGTISADQFSSTITGSSTAFTTDFKVGDVIILDDAGTTRFFSTVTFIESDTTLFIDSASDRSYSGVNVFRQALRFDKQKDAVIAEVVNTGGTFSLTNFASGNKGDDGADGATGADGKKSVVSYVYHQASSSSAPSTPSATNYNISTNSFTGLTSGWSTTPPTYAAANANKYWYSYFRATEDTAGGNTASGSNLVFQASQQGIGFSGLVTFTSDDLTDGSSTYNPATVVNSGTTTIDGGKITANSITASQINAGAIALDSNLVSGTLPASAGGTGLTSVATLLNSNVTPESIGAHPTSTTIPTALSELSGTLAASAGGTGLTSISTLLNSNVTASSIGLSNVSNLDAGGQVAAAFAADTSITAGRIQLGSALVITDSTSTSVSSSSIDLDAASTLGPRIIIADGS